MDCAFSSRLLYMMPDDGKRGRREEGKFGRREEGMTGRLEEGVGSFDRLRTGC
ncbi:MAG: hypothetical protein K8R63_04200 [Bacteroidales bacterium]|nr:hypothetical protein [Bacteroidales bacterium]